jgi:hypothetical protein
MKTRLYLLGSVLPLAAVVGLLWWSPWVPRVPPEPVYDGKPISYWFTNRITSSLTMSPVPPKTLLSDSNAVPFPIRELKRDSWIGAAVYRKQVWPKLPSSIQKHLPAPADHPMVRQEGTTTSRVV